MITIKMILMVAVLLTIIALVATIIYMHYLSTIVGYTQPQVEQYSNGQSDVISYPIYRLQGGTK